MAFKTGIDRDHTDPAAHVVTAQLRDAGGVVINRRGIIRRGCEGIAAGRREGVVIKKSDAERETIARQQNQSNS